MKIQVLEHTCFLSGYMDAVGRMLTTDSDLCLLTARAIESVDVLERDLSCVVRDIIPTNRLTAEFEKGLHKLFNVDPRDRVFFYLTEYLIWYSEFAESCHASRIQLVGEDIPEDYLAWLLQINQNLTVFIYMVTQRKNG